jgi:hypothetical protein
MGNGCCLGQLPVLGFLAAVALLLAAGALVDTLGSGDGPPAHPRPAAASPGGRR